MPRGGGAPSSPVEDVPRKAQGARRQARQHHRLAEAGGDALQVEQW